MIANQSDPDGELEAIDDDILDAIVAGGAATIAIVGAKFGAKLAVKVFPVIGFAATCYDVIDGYRGAREAGAGRLQAIGEGAANWASQGIYNWARGR